MDSKLTDSGGFKSFIFIYDFTFEMGYQYQIG